MGDVVRVVYRKFDGSLHWHYTMRRLGEDRHGVWLGLPANSHTRKGDGPPVPIPQPHVLLIPPDAWWTATFNARPCWTEIYCDITTPAEWISPDEVTTVDLDLDVIRRFDATAAQLLDEDEFAEHQLRYSYPADVIARAEQSAQWLRDAVLTLEPFRSAYRDWLSMVDR